MAVQLTDLNATSLETSIHLIVVVVVIDLSSGACYRRLAIGRSTGISLSGNDLLGDIVELFDNDAALARGVVHMNGVAGGAPKSSVLAFEGDGQSHGVPLLLELSKQNLQREKQNGCKQ